jgi:hypothetical protein
VFEDMDNSTTIQSGSNEDDVSEYHEGSKDGSEEDGKPKATDKATVSNKIDEVMGIRAGAPGFGVKKTRRL